MAHCKPKKMKFGGEAIPRPKPRPTSGLKSSPRPKPRPKNIGGMKGGSTRGVDPRDNYSESDLMKLIGSVVSPTGGGMAKKAGMAAKKATGMKDGGLVGGQHKLDKNKDGKISGADFKMMEYGGAVKKMKYGGKVGGCRGGGAAVAGTKFTGCK